MVEEEEEEKEEEEQLRALSKRNIKKKSYNKSDSKPTAWKSKTVQTVSRYIFFGFVYLFIEFFFFVFNFKRKDEMIIIIIIIIIIVIMIIIKMDGDIWRKQNGGLVLRLKMYLLLFI